MLDLAEYKRRQAAPGRQGDVEEFRPRPPLSDRQPVSRSGHAAARARSFAGAGPATPRPAPPIFDFFPRQKPDRVELVSSTREAGHAGRVYYCDRNGGPTTRTLRLLRSVSVVARPALRCVARRLAAAPPAGLPGRLRRLRQGLLVLVGDDDVAAFQRAGIVGVLAAPRAQLWPGRRHEQAGDDFLAIAERVGQRRIGRAADRNRLFDVLAGL